MPKESLSRIEPMRIECAPEAIADLLADVSAASAKLGVQLHPQTAASLASVVRIMNTYYSNLIEGHNTLPLDIERALSGDLDEVEGQRDLQIEAAAHVRVQAAVDAMADEGKLPEPASAGFICWLHKEFYRDASDEMLTIKGKDRKFMMVPGEWRSGADQDNVVGRHLPPSSDSVPTFMDRFERRYVLRDLGAGARILAMATAHHRFNYIHPFPDGNGRVSRLMSHAMAAYAGIGAHGLWSISRGMALGLQNRGDYKRMMSLADSPRAGALDGRGNLSLRALEEFTEWFLRVCLDQLTFMSSLYDLDSFSHRLQKLVDRSDTLKPESYLLLDEAFRRGAFERGQVARITGMPERSARRVLKQLVDDEGLLASSTPKGPVSLRFPAAHLPTLLPNLFAGH